MHHGNEFLATEKPSKLLLKLALPAVIAQIVNMLYNIVDRIYIGRLPGIGTDALAGVGVCLPIILLISAFAALFSMGGVPRASIAMGQGDNDRAEKVMGTCLAMLLLIAAILTVVIFCFRDGMLLAFGASAETLPYGADYLGIYALGTVFVQVSLGLNAFITAQGFSKISMLTVLIGAVLNIVLDPLFMFVFDMGVRGAALATILSQAVSALWVLRFLTGKKAILRVRLSNIRIVPRILFPCLALGISPFIMQSTEAALSICFNRQLLQFGGTQAVSAMTILSSVMQFIMLPLIGFTQGAQPIISYNYGAKNAARVKETFLALLKASMAFVAVMWLIVMVFPQIFAMLFTPDEALIAFTSKAMRIYMAMSLLLGVQLSCQQTFIAIGNAKSSLFLAVLRKIFLLIPLIYLLPAILPDKLMAVYLAEPVADFIAVSVTAALFARQFPRALQAMEVDGCSKS